MVKYVSDNNRFGTLVSTDAVWIKEPNAFVKVASTIELLKMVIFLFLNDGPDLAIWMLNNRKNDIYKSVNNNLRIFCGAASKTFLFNKVVTFSINYEHRKFFNEVFDYDYPEMNKFNESEI